MNRTKPSLQPSFFPSHHQEHNPKGIHQGNYPAHILQGKEKVFEAMPSDKTKQKDEDGKDIYQDICYPVTKEFREKLYSEIERAYAEAKEKQQEQAKEQSQKQGKEQSQDKDGFMKASGEPLPFR